MKDYSLADLKKLKENIEKITSPECTDNISEEKGPVFEKKLIIKGKPLAPFC